MVSPYFLCITIFSTDRDDRQVDRGPEIVIPPYNTSAVLGEDMSVSLECVANARSVRTPPVRTPFLVSKLGFYFQSYVYEF